MYRGAGRRAKEAGRRDRGLAVGVGTVRKCGGLAPSTRERPPEPDLGEGGPPLERCLINPRSCLRGCGAVAPSHSSFSSGEASKQASGTTGSTCNLSSSITNTNKSPPPLHHFLFLLLLRVPSSVPSSSSRPRFSALPRSLVCPPTAGTGLDGPWCGGGPANSKTIAFD